MCCERSHIFLLCFFGARVILICVMVIEFGKKFFVFIALYCFVMVFDVKIVHGAKPSPPVHLGTPDWKTGGPPVGKPRTPLESKNFALTQ